MADMADRLVIQRLEFMGFCGVTLDERQFPQPIAVDLELDCDISTAAKVDDLEKTVDYAKVAQRIVDMGTGQDACLVETMAERFVSMLFAEFPVEHVRLWVRKLDPPIKLITGSVGVRLDRTRAGQQHLSPEPVPATFLVQHLGRLPKGKVLDVAAGSGRNALYLASQGWDVHAIDRDEQALARLSSLAQQRNLTNVTVQTLDLETGGDSPELPHEQYDVVLVFFYLYRSLFPALIDALKPNGVLIYETFTIDNHLRYQHPRRWEFCLGHNELLRLTSQLRVFFYDEGEHEGGHGTGTTFTAQLVAQKLGHPRLP
jgi:dihydroneopterin aldolase